MMLKKICLLTLSGLILATSVQARPNTSVKNTLLREENPKESTKNSLVLPYAFSTESMGVTLGVGGGTKGYGQEQLLLGATVFGSFEEAVGIFLGMWDYRPSFAKRFSSVPREWWGITLNSGLTPILLSSREFHVREVTIPI